MECHFWPLVAPKWISSSFSILIPALLQTFFHIWSFKLSRQCSKYIKKYISNANYLVLFIVVQKIILFIMVKYRIYTQS